LAISSGNKEESWAMGYKIKYSSFSLLSIVSLFSLPGTEHLASFLSEKAHRPEVHPKFL